MYLFTRNSRLGKGHRIVKPPPVFVGGSNGKADSTVSACEIVNPRIHLEILPGLHPSVQI